MNRPLRHAARTRAGHLGAALLAAMLGIGVPEALAALAPAAADAAASDETSATATEETPEAQRVLDAIKLYDPANPDLGMLQRADVATRNLPRDSQGFVDWMKALRDGAIAPRPSLDGKSGMNTLDRDVILKNTKEMPWVRFPHLSHTLWLDCSNCHPAPFVAQAGANKIAMADIFRGKFCGMCHDRVAFITFFSCMRCHSVPQQAMPAGK